MKHITDSDIKHFYSHSFSEDEEMALLEHIAKCDYCAARLSSNFPENELLKPPPDLQSDIINAAKKIPSHREMKLEFYRYSTKVILAMGLALSLLTLGNFSKIAFKGAPVSIESLAPKKISDSYIDIDAEKKAYEETLQKQNDEMDEMNKKFIKEKQDKNRQKREDEKSAGSLKSFTSDLLSYFKNKK